MTSSRAPRIAVIVSGSGTNLQALIDSSVAGELGAAICGVFSDQEHARGLQRAREAGIPACFVPVGRRSDDAYDRALIDAVRAAEPDLVVLAGYMRIASPDFTREFAGRLMNIHPSLLPLHKGLDTHRRVLESGDSYHGATVHFVIDELDSGPRILQYRIPVDRTETDTTLARRVLQGEHVILPRAVHWFVTGRLRLEGLRVMLDGTPLDEPIVVEGDR
jgi:phosphoribosylglycinamide formyltransferase-1